MVFSLSAGTTLELYDSATSDIIATFADTEEARGCVPAD
jgi:hypothetical protein